MTNASDRSRKMKALFAGTDPLELAELSTEAPRPVRERVSAGAVKSMRGAFSAIEEENERLREQLSSAETVVELDPAHLFPSFIDDRLEEDNAEGFETFISSIRDFGQQVPILARPHPDKRERYQIAYGHRRWRACRQLGRPVRAIVKEMSDEALIVSQGKENSERRDLSFIEQAMFALALKRRGFDRQTIAQALGRQEDREISYISILSGIAEGLPERLVRAIGPAPRSGRPKWERLAKLNELGGISIVKSSPVGRLLSSARWKDWDSDTRLAKVLELVSPSTPSSPPPPQGGEPLPHGISYRHSGKSGHLAFQHEQAADLAEWLAKRIPDLIAQFEQRTDEKG